MKTTSKVYRFSLTLDRALPGITDERGAFNFCAHCRSTQGAESYARQQAAILSKAATPISCTIKYRTAKGEQTRTLDLRKE